MTFEEYVAIRAVNWTSLKEARRSMLHYQHRLTTPREDTESLSLGRHGHCAIFEPARFAREFIVEPEFGDLRKTDRTTKEEAKANKIRKQAWIAAHPGVKTISASDYERAIGMRDAARRHPEAMKYLADGVAEQSLTWTHKRTGLPCKARLDFVSNSKPAILDLKSSVDIALDALARAMYRYGHHNQLAFYEDGWFETHGERLPSVVIAVESKKPHDVGVFRVDEDAIEIGREECEELLTKLAVATSLNDWPGQYPSEMVLELPAWVTRNDDEDLSETDIDWSDSNG